MGTPIRNDDVRIRFEITRDPGEALRVEEKIEHPPSAPDYGDYVRILRGQGTICVPLASVAEVPRPTASACGSCPAQEVEGPASASTNLTINDPAYAEHFNLSVGLNCELIPPDEIQSLWSQILAESSQQVSKQTAEQAQKAEEKRTKKLELLLRLALKAGDIDTAMLLFSGLESERSDALSAGLMNRMQQLQKERENLAAGMTQTGDQASDAQSAQNVNAKMGGINTEMTMLQTFLQDVNEHKHETEQLASEYLKSRHDTAMGIVRNMG